MSEPKFTPGPWTINDRYEGRIYILPEADKDKVAGANFVSEKEHRARYFRTIAHIGGVFPFDGISKPEHHANVVLMAAAPDLYRALDGLFNALDSCVELTPALLLKCRTALAKARGEL